MSKKMSIGKTTSKISEKAKKLLVDRPLHRYTEEKIKYLANEIQRLKAAIKVKDEALRKYGSCLDMGSQCFHGRCKCGYQKALATGRKDCDE